MNILAPRLVILAFTVLTLSSNAWAGLGIGISGGLQKDTWTVSGTGVTSYDAPKNTTHLGVLLWLPILPTLTIRTGYLLESQAYTVNSSGSTSSVTLINAVIPANLQIDLPLTGLYVFGGLLLASNQSIDPSSNTKNSNDTRTNLGLGYDMLGLPLMGLDIELEYQKGGNVSPSAGFDTKMSAIGMNLVFKIGF